MSDERCDKVAYVTIRGIPLHQVTCSLAKGHTDPDCLFEHSLFDQPWRQASASLGPDPWARHQPLK